MASLGKLVNYWREHHHEFIETWERIHGAQQPGEKVSYRRCPLRLVSGRWGSVHSCESFLLLRGRGFLQPVLLAMFSRRMKAANPGDKLALDPKGQSKAPPRAKQPKSKAKSDKVDLLLDEDSRASYNLKMSKWANGACQAVLSSLFWLLLECKQKIREPLAHFSFWCQSLQTKQGRGVIIELVTGKAEQFLKEFQDNLVSLDTWFAAAVDKSQARDLPSELLAMTKAMCFKLILRGASDFHMRVVQQTQRYPLKLLWMTLDYYMTQLLVLFNVKFI